MITPELIGYIKNQFKLGKNRDEIKQSLLIVGWQESDIEEALSNLPDKITPLRQGRNFLKPEITSISRATWNILKISWQFWTILALTMIGSAILVAVTIQDGSFDYLRIFAIFYVIIAVYVYHIQNKVRSSFWKQFAEINGWQYERLGDVNQESGIMFRQGNARNMSNIIKGNIDGRQFKIFNYQFSIGSGKNKETYYYTVFAFKFNGSFPHIYLNNKHNSYGVKVGEMIPVPGEFEKKFSLSAPRKYEIEALEIFTPDVLENLLNNGFAHDVEFIDQNILIFTVGEINRFEQLEKEFNLALDLEDLLDEKLDRIKFEKIGDMPHTLY